MPDTGAPWNIPYAANSDLVSAWPALSEDIADEVAAGLDSVLAGTIRQVVRATDATLRTTSSSTFVDASISVTITPQYDDSQILVIWAAQVDTDGDGRRISLQITTSADVALSGAESAELRVQTEPSETLLTIIGHEVSGSTAVRTYKGRFKSSATSSINNNVNTGQLYAIEVKA
jgi:hypothetical protein